MKSAVGGSKGSGTNDWDHGEGNNLTMTVERSVKSLDEMLLSSLTRSCTQAQTKMSFHHSIKRNMLCFITIRIQLRVEMSLQNVSVSFLLCLFSVFLCLRVNISEVKVTRNIYSQ